MELIARIERILWIKISLWNGRLQSTPKANLKRQNENKQHHIASKISDTQRPLVIDDSSSDAQRPVVIGGSNFDVICRVNEAGLEPNASTVNAKIRTCFGGVGRSLAEALAR